MQRFIHISLLRSVLLLLVSTLSGLSQDLKQRDNLLTRLKQSMPDTNRVNLLLSIGWYYMDILGELPADIDSATTYMKRAERLSNTLVDKVGKPTINHIKLLLRLSEFYCLKPSELPIDTDSAIYYAKRAQYLCQFLHSPLSTKTLELIGNALYEKHDTLRAQNYFFRAIKEYENRTDTVQLALIWERFGEHIPHASKNVQKKINCYKQAFNYYHQSKNQDRELRMINYIEYTYEVQQNTQKALSELQPILKLYTSENYPLLSDIYFHIWIIEYNRSNYNVALKYALKAIQLAQSNHKTNLLGDYYFQLSLIYRRLGKESKRVESCWKSFEYCKINKEVDGIYASITSICRSLLEQHKAQKALSLFRSIQLRYPIKSSDAQISSTNFLASLYEAAFQYTKAEKNYLKLLHLVDKFDNSNKSKVYAYRFVGRFYLNRNNYSKARYYLNWNRNHISSPTELQISNYDLFKLDSAQGDFQSALAHFQQYTILKDSIITASKARQIDELLIQYETRIKEHRIDLLTSQAREQQARVQQATLTRNVAFGGVAMLLLLLGLIYNRYRLKQTQQAQIQVKNQALEELVGQKAWLLKEIHHRVKNNLQLIISLLQSQGKYLLDKSAISAIEQSEHRVRAMALIHQKLYRDENLSQIDMCAYIQEVAQQLSDSFDPEQRIAFHYDLAPLELDVSQAIPLGLIINEAITNAFKYAFPNEQAGNIYLSLSSPEMDRYRLQVKDDGVGLPTGVNLGKSNSMGANIMQGLSQQLGSSLEVTSGQGLEVSVLFEVFNPLAIPTYATH